MKCFEKRTIFNFWKYMDCLKCNHRLVDEEIIIGVNKIYIYNIRKCNWIDVDKDSIFLKSQKVRLFLKDCIINQKNIIFVVLEDFNLEKNIEWIESFLEESGDIHILNI